MKKFKFLTGEIGRSGELVKKFKFLTGEIGRIGELVKKPDFVNDSVNDFDETGHSDEIVKKFKFLSDNTMKTKPPDVELLWLRLRLNTHFFVNDFVNRPPPLS